MNCELDLEPDWDPEQVNRIYQSKSVNDFMLFVRGLIIPGVEGPAMFDTIMADFQREAFEVLGEALKAIQEGVEPKNKRIWMERTKKAGKDADLAICVVWLIAFCQRPLKIQISAANQKQASILKSRIEDLLHYNLWLQDLVKITQNRITGTALGGNLVRAVIESTGSAGAAHGETPDVLILNELVHVDRWDVMEAHMNNADGVPHGLVIVSTNAGFKGTKAHKWRKFAIRSPRWIRLIWKKPAPWTSEENLIEAKARNDPFEFARLWEGKWVSGRGGALTEDDIAGCFRSDLGPMSGEEPDWVFVAGLDLGVSKDHAGIVVVGANRKENRLRVALVRGFTPTLDIPGKKRKEVDGQAVEEACFSIGIQYHVRHFNYDPAAGGSFMAQSLRSRGVAMREMTFSAANLTLMAQSLVTSAKDGKLECYEDPEGRLRRDLGKFDIQAKIPSGFRLVSVADEYGHADVGTALAICLPSALYFLDTGGLQPDDVMEIEGGEFDMADVPEELREILDM